MKKRTHESGQTSVEYLMLLAVAFLTAYLMVSGPVASFTIGMIERLKGALGNVNQNGELAEGQLVQPGTSGHPSDPTRLKRLH